MTFRLPLAAALVLLTGAAAAAQTVAPVATASGRAQSDAAIDAYLKAASSGSADSVALDGPGGGDPCRPEALRVRDGAFDARYPLDRTPPDYAGPLSRRGFGEGADGRAYPRGPSIADQVVARAGCTPDRQIHGVVSAGIGTGGYRDVSATVVAPVGDAVVGLSVSSSHYGGRR